MKMMRSAAVFALAVALSVSGVACKDGMKHTVLANMGGMEGVTKLMQNWTSAMAADASLSQALTADDMNMVARGFATSVAKASEMPTPNDGVDLVKVLKDKNLSKDTLGAMGAALEKACGTSALSPDATKAAKHLWHETVEDVNKK